MSAGKWPFFPVLRFFFLLHFLIHTKIPSAVSSCLPSSCGSIKVIQYPFRLKTDPISCGHHNTTYFELDCQNNQTVMNLSSRRWYYVQEINYEEHTTRLVDPGINNRNLSACPLYSNSNYGWRLPVSLYNGSDINVPVIFIHCSSPAKSVKYVKAPFCGYRNDVFGNTSGLYSYVLRGFTQVSDLEDFCTVDKVNWVSIHGVVKDNSSLSSIYDGLAYGFDVWWFPAVRGTCWDSAYFTYGSFLLVRCCYQDLPYVPVICLPHHTYVIFLYFYASQAGLKFLIIFPLLMWLVVYKWRRRHLSMDKTIEEFLQSQNTLTPIMYTYSEIKKMTNKFKQKLGEGGYGTVYKGKLRSGPYVAVKMMEKSIANEEEFISEVSTIGQIHHTNVVQLIGFCVERSKYTLVYEFLPNGSLDRYIFNQQCLDIVALTHKKMFEIALGVARGIAYLHHGCNMQILHFDIKPHNILLDNKFHAKISDFGLARLHPNDESSINLTAARGTIGYMAPEMFYKNIGGISHKADVYSFGMLLIEMASRRKNMNPFVEDKSQTYFPSWVHEQLRIGKDLEIKDTTEEERKIIKRIIMVALWCIQMKPSDRPTMNKVVEMLEGDCETRMPPRPFVLAPEEANNQEIARSFSVDYVTLNLADN